MLASLIQQEFNIIKKSLQVACVPLCRHGECVNPYSPNCDFNSAKLPQESKTLRIRSFYIAIVISGYITKALIQAFLSGSYDQEMKTYIPRLMLVAEGLCIQSIKDSDIKQHLDEQLHDPEKLLLVCSSMFELNLLTLHCSRYLWQVKSQIAEVSLKELGIDNKYFIEVGESFIPLLKKYKSIDQEIIDAVYREHFIKSNIDLLSESAVVKKNVHAMIRTSRVSLENCNLKELYDWYPAGVFLKFWNNPPSDNKKFWNNQYPPEINKELNGIYRSKKEQFNGINESLSHSCSEAMFKKDPHQALITMRSHYSKKSRKKRAILYLDLLISGCWVDMSNKERLEALGNISPRQLLNIKDEIGDELKQELARQK